MLNAKAQGDSFQFVARTSGRSARFFLDRIRSEILPQSVLDVGCGRGVWLQAWMNLGVSDVTGVDSENADVKYLRIKPENFLVRDILRPFSLGRKYDLVECLDVAEHIPEESTDVLLQNLVAHGDVVLFSAARPGRSKELHTNEKPLQYWMERFADCGYSAFDFPRMQVSGCRDVSIWYRYNAMLFANSDGEKQLRTPVWKTKVTPDSQDNYIPLWWRIRNRLMHRLPESSLRVIDGLKDAVNKTLGIRR